MEEMKKRAFEEIPLPSDLAALSIVKCFLEDADRPYPPARTSRGTGRGWVSHTLAPLLDRFVSSARMAGFRATQIEEKQDKPRAMDFSNAGGGTIAEVLPGPYDNGGAVMRIDGSTAARRFIP